MKKQFDPTKPHTHYCSNWRCNKPVHCRAVNCEIPQQAECLECQRGEAVQRFSFVQPLTFRHVTGYRRTARRGDSY